MIYLIDTNVLSEQRKPTPDPAVVTWLGAVDQRITRISVVTIGEIRRGITKLELRNDHQQAANVDRWLSSTIRDFSDRIALVSTDVALRWGDADARRPLPTADGLIGATAAVNGWTLVTRNSRDFEHLGIRLLNPFSM